MQTIQLEVRDDYIEKIVNFLKLLPENVAKIKLDKNFFDDELETELLSRVDDIKKNKISTLSRDEVFDDL